MHTITYTSTARTLLVRDELESLLVKSRENNQKFGITGLLLYKGGHFIQSIEGPGDAIARLYKNIQADPAHYNVITLLDEPIQERIFPEWSMGFVYGGQGSVDGIPGYTDFLRDENALRSFLASASQTKLLLAVFGQSIR